MELSDAVMELARAINRLARTQESDHKSGKVNFTVASYDYVDEQTKRLREISKEISAPRSPE